MNLEEIRRAILSAYKSTTSPRYGFTSRRYALEPYREVIAELSERFAVEETTDLNDDVCVSLYLRRGDLGYGLQLSLVGKYAVLTDSRGRFVDALSQDVDDVRFIVSVVQRKEITLLNEHELRRRLPFRAVNSEEEDASLYEILFSSEEAVD